MATDLDFEVPVARHENSYGIANKFHLHLTSHSLQPKTTDAEGAKQALKTLNGILLGEPQFKITPATLESFTSTVQGVILTNTPVSSYALGVWDRSEPILCSIAGTPSENTFFSLAKARFRKSGAASITILKANRNAVDMFHLGIDSFRFVLQYRQLPVSLSSEVSKVLSSSSDDSRDSVASNKTRTYRDTAYVKNCLLDQAVFRMSYFSIKNWALSHGIYSPRFKYLRELDLIILVANACQKVAIPHDTEQVIAQFLREFTTFQFDRLVILGDDAQQRVHESNASLEKSIVDRHPRIDFTKSMSSETFCIIKEVVNRTQKLAVGHPYSTSYLTTFASQYRSYIQISLSYWGSSLVKGGRFVDIVEMAVAEWITSSNQSHPHPKLYIWPTRVKDSRKDASDGCYEAFYVAVIGSATTTASPDLDSQLPDLLSRLLSTIRSNPSYDTTTSFADVHPTSNIPAVHLTPDTKDWGLIPDEDKPADSDDDDDDPSGEADFWSPSHPKRHSKTKSHHTNPSAEGTSLLASEPRHPLRPALDILSRLRHDRAYDAEDYVVGYVDRHVGVKEMPVAWWRGEDSTAEEFIPQSRIRYYRRKSDGLVVWDRERKLDLVFESGGLGPEGSL